MPTSKEAAGVAVEDPADPVAEVDSAEEAVLAKDLAVPDLLDLEAQVDMEARAVSVADMVAAVVPSEAAVVPSVGVKEATALLLGITIGRLVLMEPDLVAVARTVH